MLRWMWEMYGIFSLMKLVMWDLPFMSLKFSYYMCKYTFIAMYYVVKITFEIWKFIFIGLRGLARIF